MQRKRSRLTGYGRKRKVLDCPGQYLTTGNIAKEQRGILTKKMECIEKQQVPFPLQVTACGKGNGIIPFAEFCTAGAGYQGKVKIGWLRIAEESLQMDLPGRGG
jgi:hypothetical protein